MTELLDRLIEISPRLKKFKTSHNVYRKLANTPTSNSMQHYQKLLTLDSQDHSNNNCFLKNNINGQLLHTSTSKITLANLRTSFETNGHTFSIRLAHQYSNPLLLDFDCNECKRKVEHSQVNIELITGIIIPQIRRILIDVLQIDAVDLLVCKKQNSCNLHIYCNGIAVSILLYERIRLRLIADLDECVTDRYLIDNIIALDLPYSTKDGLNVYTPIIGNKLLMVMYPFYDISARLTAHIDVSTELHICSFKISKEIDNPWQQEKDIEHHLVIQISSTVEKKQTPNNVIVNLRNSPIKVECQSKLLQTYVNNHSNTQTKLLDEHIDIGNHQLDEYFKLLLLDLGKKIGNLTLGKTDTNCYFSNILEMLTMNNSNYCFYGVVATISYIINTNLKHCDVDVDVQVEHILNILSAIVTSYDNPGTVEILMTTIKCLKRFKVYSKLRHIFTKPEEWFSELTKIYQRNTSGSSISHITNKLIAYDTNEDVLNILCELCSLEFPIIRLSKEQSTFYYYHSGLYHLIKERELLSHNSLNVKELIIKMQSLLDELLKTGQISTELHIECKKSPFLHRVLISYWAKAKVIKPQFNMYDYFISTQLGIFNILTGHYMSNVPLIYMTTEKCYCTIDLQNPSLVNNTTMYNRYESYTKFLTQVIKLQPDLYYLSVVVPGLLTLSQVLYTKADQEEMKNSIITNIEMHRHLEDKFYYLVPVLVKYNLCIHALYKVSVLIAETINNCGRYDWQDITETASRVTLTYDSPVKDFDYSIFMEHTNNANIFELVTVEILKIYPECNLKYMAIALLLLVMDISDGENHTQFELEDKNLENIEYINLFNLRVLDEYSVYHHTNFSRALRVLNIISPSIHAEMLLHSLSTSFEFCTATLHDFFSVCAMIYTPNSPKKKLVFLTGNPNCGKTTIQHFMNNIHKSSNHSVDSIVSGSSGGSNAAPNIIQIYNSYLFTIAELSKIFSDFLKSVTGSDIVHHRGVFQNEFVELKPLAFVLAASNALPIIEGADEAIKIRLVPFLMSCKYGDKLDDCVDDNSLFIYLKHILIKNQKFNIELTSMELSNLLYSQYLTIRNEQGLIDFHIQEDNVKSIKILNDCLCMNNYIYNILQRAGIVFGGNLSISHEQLDRLLPPYIEKYNEEKCPNRKVTIYGFKREMERIFVNHLKQNNNGYWGFGRPGVDRIFIGLKYSPGSIVKIINYKRLLLENEYSIGEVKLIIDNTLDKYSNFYNINLQYIKDHAIDN